LGEKIERRREVISMDTRWFISYRVTVCDFVNNRIKEVTYHSVVTNITPANWLKKHTFNHHIDYAERVSMALASELMYCGTGIPAEYFDGEEEE